MDPTSILWFFVVGILVPLLFWTALAVKSLLDGPAERRREEQRLREIVDFRRRYVGLTANDPVAHESLGDALRTAGHARAALDAFLEAERLASVAHRGSPEVGPLDGFGLQSKIRLTRLEIAQTERPEAFGMTMATRDVICPRCKNLAPPKILDCPTCGHPMPTDTMAEAWNHGSFRLGMLTDAKNLFWKVMLLGVAIGCALAIPDPMLKFATIISALFVLTVLLLKKIGDP